MVIARSPEIAPAMSGTFRLPDGREAVPVFQLLAERFLADAYAPEATEKETGIPAATVRRIAAELAHAAFKEEIVLDIPWTDMFGRRHDKMIGRPVGMHAMRGISAHANGFHTARMLHILQILLGSIDCPGGFRYKAPYPKLAPPFLIHRYKQHRRPRHPRLQLRSAQASARRDVQAEHLHHAHTSVSRHNRLTPEPQPLTTPL